MARRAIAIRAAIGAVVTIGLLALATCNPDRDAAPLIDTYIYSTDSRVTLSVTGRVAPNSLVRVDIAMADGASYIWSDGARIQQRTSTNAWRDAWTVESPANDPAPGNKATHAPIEELRRQRGFTTPTGWTGPGFQVVRLPGLAPGRYRLVKRLGNEQKRIKAVVEFEVEGGEGR